MPLLTRALPRARVLRGALLLASMSVSASSAPAQGSSPTTPAAAAAAAVPFDAAVRVGTLPNGLRYYLQRHAVPAGRAELRLAVDVGSLMETPAELGVAHFVEHMAFNGSRRFAKQAIQRELEAMGMQFGADLNATTSADETTYLLTLPTDRPGALATGVRILADWAGSVTFDSAAVEAERGIIESEWRLRTGAGASEFQRMGRVLRAALPGTAYGDRLPIGDPRIIRTVRPSALKAFYRRWYRPSRMAVIVVGDIDVATVERLVRTELGAVPAGPRSAESDRAWPARTVAPRTTPAYLVDVDSSATLPSLAISYRMPVRGSGRAVVRSGLIQRVVEEILAERAGMLDLGSARVSMAARQVRTWTLETSVAGDSRAILAGLLGLPAQVREHGLSDEEVSRVRNQLLSEYERNFDARDALTSAQLAAAYRDVFYSGGVVPSRDTLLALARESLTGTTAISVDEVNAMARELFEPRGLVAVATLPPGTPPLDSMRAVALIDSVARAVAPTLRQRFVARPLVASLPPAGRIDSVRTIPQVGVTVWHLSNGARVVLKRTDFNPDQMLVTAAASGGWSLAADSEFVESRLGADAIAQGGVGSFSNAALQRKLGLTGSAAGVTAVVTDYSHGLQGGASPRDAETLFALLHLKLTAPRLDTVAINRWRAQVRDALARPDAKANQAFEAIRFLNDPRARPITAAMVDSLDPQRALAFYRARYGDASAFTFYFVGAFNPDSLRPLVERYLASLPSTRAGSRWRDMGVRQVEGRTVEIPDGAQPGRASVSLLFAAPLPWDSTSNPRLWVLSRIAQRRLTQRLRTGLGATYAVTVNENATPFPAPRAEVVATFDADPARADSLAAAAIAVIDSLARTGPTAAELAELKEAWNRTLELALRNNDYWLIRLQNDGLQGLAYTNGVAAPPDPRLEGLNEATARAMAAQLFDTTKAVRIIFRPRAGSATARDRQ